MPTTSLPDLGQRAKAAARLLATLSSSAKDEALVLAADRLSARSDEILSANASDVGAGASPTVVDRLRLSEARVVAMADGLRSVAMLPDPVGEVVEGHVRPNGLRVERVRVPLGVVGIIYENRPNVTADAAALCLKSGNAAMLRGSAGALESNRVIASSLREAIGKAGLPADAVLLVEDTAHETAVEFVRLRGVIDCLIPRGGPALLSMILEHAPEGQRGYYASYTLQGVQAGQILAAAVFLPLAWWLPDAAFTRLGGARVLVLGTGPLADTVRMEARRAAAKGATARPRREAGGERAPEAEAGG